MKEKDIYLHIDGSRVSADDLGLAENPSVHLPDTFKSARAYMGQTHKVEPNLFSSMLPKAESGYVISGLPQKVSELDLSSFTYAVSKILYNQSLQCGDSENFHGRRGILQSSLTESMGRDVYSSEVITTLNDLCREAYGTNSPTTQQRKIMDSVIRAVDTTPVKITYPNGDERETKLCAVMDRYTRAKDGAVAYRISLNPIFSENIARNFAEIPQRAMYQLSAVIKERGQRRSVAHIRLLERLCMQDKRKPYRITLLNLTDYLGLGQYMAKNRKLALQKLTEVCDTILQLGVITAPPHTETAEDGSIVYVFTLNPDYGHNP